MKKRVYCVIPAAGVGKRMQSDLPKQYIKVLGKCVIEHTIKKLLCLNIVYKIIVALHKDDKIFSTLSIANNPDIVCVNGGAERQDSVLNCINAIDDENAWVLVHDAVRPCVNIADIKKMYLKTIATNKGTILVSPVTDTIKQLSSTGSLVKTLSRNALRQALTPQLFDKKILQQSLLVGLKNKVEFTDESNAVEFSGHSVLPIDSCSSNIKLTTSKDLYMIEKILQE